MTTEDIMSGQGLAGSKGLRDGESKVRDCFEG